MNRVWLVFEDNTPCEVPELRSIHTTKDLADTAARQSERLGTEMLVEEWEVKGCSD